MFSNGTIHSVWIPFLIFLLFFNFFFLGGTFTCHLSFFDWRLLPMACVRPCPPAPSLSMSPGGPAFLRGFCRPRCEEHWRWRGRSTSVQSLCGPGLRLLAPQWSPPQNCRPSLSAHATPTSQSKWRAPWQLNILLVTIAQATMATTSIAENGE